MVYEQYLLMGAGLYVSLIVIKQIISREGQKYVAAEMARHGHIEKHEVTRASIHIGIVSSLALIPFLVPILYKERLSFFLPYPKSDLKYFAEHGEYPND